MSFCSKPRKVAGAHPALNFSWGRMGGQTSIVPAKIRMVRQISLGSLDAATMPSTVRIVGSRNYTQDVSLHQLVPLHGSYDSLGWG
jgi:hypothetical protein